MTEFYDCTAIKTLNASPRVKSFGHKTKLTTRNEKLLANPVPGETLIVNCEQMVIIRSKFGHKLNKNQK